MSDTFEFFRIAIMGALTVFILVSSVERLRGKRYKGFTRVDVWDCDTCGERMFTLSLKLHRRTCK